MAKSRSKARKSIAKINLSRQSADVQVTIIDRLADAALIAAIFIVLVFSQLRFEAYETEKTALMPIFGGIILASHLTGFLRSRQFPQKQVLLHPMLIGFFGIVLTSCLSAIFSFSFARSWFGEPERMNGLQTFLVYALLFIHALSAYERITRLLTPILITISLPLCLNAIFADFMGEIDRPGSTTGNPNFLSSWLMLALLIVLGQLFIWMRQRTGDWHWKALPILIFAPLIFPILPIVLYSLIYRETHKQGEQRWTGREWAYFSFILAVAIFMAITVLIVGSRAALLAYTVSGVVVVCLLLGFAHQKRILFAFVGLFTLLCCAYFGASQVASAELKSSFRFLSFADEQRLELWKGGLAIISQFDIPYVQYNETADTQVGIRPLLGYGLSVIAQTQGRIGATSHGNQFVSSYHNHIFDRIITTGYAGLIAYILFNLAALVSVLKIFNYAGRNFLGCLVVCIVSGIVGILIAPLIFEGASIGTVLPIGASLGVIAGTIIWIVFTALRQAEDHSVRLSPAHIMLAILLGTMILHWIDIQFGFVQAASAPLRWILAGLLLGHLFKFGANSVDNSEIEAVINSRPIDWQVSILSAGVIVLAMFGTTIGSAIYVLEIGSERILWLLLIMVLGGHMGAFLVSSDEHRYHFRFLLVMLGAWFIMFIIKQLITALAGTAFDSAITTENMSVATITMPFLSLSLVAIMMIVFVILAWVFYEGWHRVIFRWMDMAILILFALIGMTFYIVNFTSSTLHAAGLVFDEQAVATQEIEYFDVAELLFTASIELDPTNARLRLHFMDMIRNNLALDSSRQIELEATFETQRDALFFYEPYFNNTIEWQSFVGIEP